MNAQLLILDEDVGYKVYEQPELSLLYDIVLLLTKNKQ